MGKNALVIGDISEKAIAVAQGIMAEFRSDRLTLDDVFWLRRDEYSDWKIALGIPGVSFFSVRPALEDLESAMAELEEHATAPDWDQIMILDTNSPYVTALRNALHPYQRSNYQLSDVWIDGVYFGGFFTIKVQPVAQFKCDLRLDESARSFLSDATVNSGHVYVWARGLTGYSSDIIVGHGRINQSSDLNRLTVDLDLPEKYAIGSSRTMICQSYQFQIREQFGDAAIPRGRIGHVLIDLSGETEM